MIREIVGTMRTQITGTLPRSGSEIQQDQEKLPARNKS